MAYIDWYLYLFGVGGDGGFCRPNGHQSDMPRTVVVRNDRLQKVQYIADFHVAEGFYVQHLVTVQCRFYNTCNVRIL